MAKTRRRRCSICGELFVPHPRVKGRQRTCSRVECQGERRIQTQASWRARNPDYFTERRLRQRAMVAEAEGSSDAQGARQLGRPPPPLRVSPALRSLPWDLAQSELGVFAVDFLALAASRVLSAAQDQISLQVSDSSRVKSC
jgi:hypothetical protein